MALHRYGDFRVEVFYFDSPCSISRHADVRRRFSVVVYTGWVAMMSGLLSEWPSVQWPFVGGLLSGGLLFKWPFVLEPAYPQISLSLVTIFAIMIL